MDFALALFNNFALTTREKVDAFLEYFEDEPTRGISISEKEATYIIEASSLSSKEHGRVIIDSSLAQRVALRFVKSDFLSSFNFAPAVSAVIEQIFRVQSETGDRFTDNELIDSFFEFFESRNCAGSLSLLEDYATQIIEKTNRAEGSELSTDDLSFTTFDFRGFNDVVDKKEEDEQ